AARIPFEVIPLDVEESYPDSLSPQDIPEYLAQKKAAAAMPFAKGGIVLAADSLVLKDNKVYGKPADRDEAITMIGELAGEVHQVITGVCLVNTRRQRCFSCTSHVHLDQMTDEEIAYYVDQFEPYDKAGAYAIQEWIGHCKIRKIEGSYNNIMGLPTHMVYEALRTFR
ncbi:MAG: Maf family nucleotide pyrophosphatase, partial [Saprospiraceae bacterium]|nr:Maf family nucleotide pyrophosphatase [Saprospiraceae bacterium]